MILAVTWAARDAADWLLFLTSMSELPSSRLRILGSPTCGTRVTDDRSIDRVRVDKIEIDCCSRRGTVWRGKSPGVKGCLYSCRSPAAGTHNPKAACSR